MMRSNCLELGRRAFLAGVPALLVAGAAMRPARGQGRRLIEVTLVAAKSRAAILGGSQPETAVWAYSGEVPGPMIRGRQGDRLRVVVQNRLDEGTTVHWHGLRVPNSMDGVPGLTQPSIAPGESFTYEFDLIDAGTYWYHPHQRSYEQVDRGLYGALIIEEAEPPAVDRDVTWVLDDWTLEPDGSISADYGNWHDIAHAGRIGDTVTVNGRVAPDFTVRAGERIRLRLINAANGRIFALRFDGHAPLTIALDGRPVEPHARADGRVLLAPSQRADLVIDMNGAAGARYTVQDEFYRGPARALLDLAYGPEPARPEHARNPVPALPDQSLPEPDPATAARHRVVFEGGMMGGLASAQLDGRTVGMREMLRQGMAWSVNGVAVREHVHEPLFTLARGRSCVIELVNDTAWFHPMHLHGHVFRVVSRDGKPTQRREWRDTVLVAPREKVEIAFVADNPGDWMFHCHVLEHQAGGMMGIIRVA
jgi:FtsP/CotA-like multicopper oxidase with cupredoxin domain